MKIVIVGGGAGGLELATKLGKKMGLKGSAEVLLLDRNHVHLWKPLLHEVASGSPVLIVHYFLNSFAFTQSSIIPYRIVLESGYRITET